jgi:hypothetical protein
MLGQSRQLCDLCHEREAEHSVFDGGTKETKNLCSVCYKATTPPDELELDKQMGQAIRNGRCQYCGEPSIGGAGGEMPFIGKRLLLWCERCKRDLADFFKQPENQLPSFDPKDAVAMKEMEYHLKEIQRRQEEFMQQRVRERNKKGD